MKTLQVLQKHRQTLIAMAVFVVLTGILFWGMRKQTQAFHFEDETDHVTMGWMMVKFHKTLYNDLSINHQPFPVLVGAVLAKFISFTTMFELVDHIRFSMFLYAAFWGVLLTLRFRFKGIIAYTFTYSLSYYFFALHVLAESLAAPAVMMALLMLTEYVFEKNKRPKITQTIDAVLASLAFATLISTLLPLWPFVALAGIGILGVFTKQQRIMLIAATSLLLLSLLFFFSPNDWFNETVVNNWLYFMPTAPKASIADWLSLLLFPFVSVLKPLDQLSQTLLFPLVVALLSLTWLGFSTKKIAKKNIAIALYVYLLLIMTNQRVFTFPIAFYQGFHLFPFIAAFFSVFALIIAKLFHNVKRLPVRSILVVVLAVLFVFNFSWAWKRVDKLNEYYVQYGTQDSYARMIEQFKSEGDTFLSGPNGFGYMNMRANIPIAGRQLFHLPWAYSSPKLREEFHQLMAENPPAFIYLLDDESGYHTELQPILKQNYTELIEDKHRTFLFLANTKVQNITPEQQKYLDEKNFHFRTKEEVEIY